MITLPPLNCDLTNPKRTPQLWQPLPQPKLCCFSLPVITCTSPSIKDGEVAEGQRAVYHPGDNVTFQCHPGFVLRGSRGAKCQPDSRWVPAVPTCQPGEPGVTGFAVAQVLHLRVKSLKLCSLLLPWQCCSAPRPPSSPTPRSAPSRGRTSPVAPP